MPEFALAAAGVMVFAITTWASLTFGYQVFQNMWETDQTDSAAPTGPTSDDRAIPVLAVAGIDGEVAARASSSTRPVAAAGELAAR